MLTTCNGSEPLYVNAWAVTDLLSGLSSTAELEVCRRDGV